MYSILFIFLLLIVFRSTYSDLSCLEFNLEDHISSRSSQTNGLANNLTNNLKNIFSNNLLDIRLNILKNSRANTLPKKLYNEPIRTINLNSGKIDSKDEDQKKSKFKNYLNVNILRRRRNSIDYSNNLSSDKQQETSIPLSQFTEIRNKIDLMNLIRNKSLNLTLNQTHYLSNDNSSGFNNTAVPGYLELPPPLKVVFYCVYTIIFFIGLIANSLNIYVVYSNKNMYNVTYFFITNLAMSDILLCLVAVPITPMYLLLYKHWPFGKWLCHLLPFSQGVSVYVSAFTLMSIAVDRYFVVIFPFKKRMSVRMCVCIIVIIWITGSTLALPYAIFMKWLEEEDELDGKKMKFCEEAWPSETLRRTFSTITTVIQFVVPFVIIAFCYSKVCSKLKIRAKFKPGAKSARKEELERERSRRTNRMLIAMVIMFGLAWLPLNLHNLFVDFYEFANNLPFMRCFFLVAHVIAMSCTCYNFFLYAYLNDHFRKNFKDVLPCFDFPFFQRMTNQNQSRQANNSLNIGLKTSNVNQLNTSSPLPLTSTRDLPTKTEPSTRQIILTEDDHTDFSPNVNEKLLAQANTMCSEPVTIYLDDKPSITKCPCSISYPNFQSSNSLTNTNSLVEQQQAQTIQDKEMSSTSNSGNKLIKSLRSKLRFSGESSFDEQPIALNQYISNEPNNNNPIRSNDQTSSINNVSNAIANTVCTSQTNGQQNNLSGNNNLHNNGKCNTIYLNGLNDKSLPLQMDNV